MRPVIREDLRSSLLIPPLALVLLIVTWGLQLGWLGRWSWDWAPRRWPSWSRAQCAAEKSDRSPGPRATPAPLSDAGGRLRGGACSRTCNQACAGLARSVRAREPDTRAPPRRRRARTARPRTHR